MEIHQIIVTIVTLITGILGVPITQYIKNKLGWTDRGAYVLAAAISVVLALIELLAGQQLAFSDFTLANFTVVFTAVHTVSTAFYKLLKADK